MPSIISATTTNGLVTSADNSGSLQLATNNGTTAVTIDTSQNVGIGTTSPVYKLHVNTTFDHIHMTNPTTGTTGSDGFTLDAFGTSARLIQRESAPMEFYTAGTERMRIDSSGNLLVGTTGGTGAYVDISNTVNTNRPSLFVDSTAATATNQQGITVRLNGDPNNTSNFFVRCFGGGTERAQIRSNGGLANFSANNVNLSDQREKKDIELAGNYLDKICAIPVKTFNYLDQPTDDLEKNLGVVAQDVQAVAPELVTESDWGTEDNPKMRLSIYQTDLQYALMKSIQELKAELDATKAEVQALKGTA